MVIHSYSCFRERSTVMFLCVHRMQQSITGTTFQFNMSLKHGGVHTVQEGCCFCQNKSVSHRLQWIEGASQHRDSPLDDLV